MSELVSDVIASRRRESDALGRTLGWSVLAHVLITALVWIIPSERATPPPREVMSVSLGGSPGPRAGGLTQMGGRSVQAVAPPRPLPRPPTPAAALPRPSAAAARPRAQAATVPPSARAVPEARGSTPSTGEQIVSGNTRTDTRVRGQGFGLSSAGGSAGGPVQLDVSNFCCPDYLEQMIGRIQSNWQQNLGVVGTTVMKFTVMRDGTVQAVQVERASGVILLDSAADRAVRLTAKLAPLPAQFPNSSLTVHMRFEYVQ